MRMNSNFHTGSASSSGAGISARSASGSVRYEMIRYSRLTKRYGPGGNAGLCSGIAKARWLTSSSVMACFRRCGAAFLPDSAEESVSVPDFSLAPIKGDRRHGLQLVEAESFDHVDDLRAVRPDLDHGQVGVVAADAGQAGQRIGAGLDQLALAALGEVLHHHEGALGADGQVHRATDRGNG